MLMLGATVHLFADERAATAALARPPKSLRTLPEQIAEQIYADIVAGRYQSGERIREEALAAGFGVSRGPVREAIRILERDAVVRVLPNKGAHVTKLSVKELNDIFEIRILLAGAMIRRLAEASPAVIASIGEKVAALERLAVQSGKVSEYAGASLDLVLSIAQAAGNQRLAEILQSLARQSSRYTQIVLSEPARRKLSASKWRTLFEALSVGCTEEASRVMEQMVDELRIEAVRHLSDEQASI